VHPLWLWRAECCGCACGNFSQDWSNNEAARRMVSGVMKRFVMDGLHGVTLDLPKGGGAVNGIEDCWMQTFAASYEHRFAKRLTEAASCLKKHPADPSSEQTGYVESSCARAHAANTLAKAAMNGELKAAVAAAGMAKKVVEAQMEATPKVANTSALVGALNALQSVDKAETAFVSPSSITCSTKASTKSFVEPRSDEMVEIVGDSVFEKEGRDAPAVPEEQTTQFQHPMQPTPPKAPAPQRQRVCRRRSVVGADKQPSKEVSYLVDAAPAVLAMNCRPSTRRNQSATCCTYRPLTRRNQSVQKPKAVQSWSTTTDPWAVQSFELETENDASQLPGNSAMALDLGDGATSISVPAAPRPLTSHRRQLLASVRPSLALSAIADTAAPPTTDMPRISQGARAPTKQCGLLPVLAAPPKAAIQACALEQNFGTASTSMRGRKSSKPDVI